MPLGPAPMMTMSNRSSLLMRASALRLACTPTPTVADTATRGHGDAARNGGLRIHVGCPAPCRRVPVSPRRFAWPFLGTGAYTYPFTLAAVMYAGSVHHRSIPKSSAMALAQLYPGPNSTMPPGATLAPPRYRFFTGVRYCEQSWFGRRYPICRG